LFVRFFLQDGVDYDEQGFIDVSDLFLCYQQDFIDGVDHDDQSILGTPCQCENTSFCSQLLNMLFYV